MAVRKTANLELIQGETWSRVFRHYTDAAKTTRLNITGYTAFMQVRTAHYEDAPTATPILDLSVGSGITLSDAANGELTVLVSDTVSELLVAGTYLWDLEIVSGAGVVTKSGRGLFVISKEVTR